MEIETGIWIQTETEILIQTWSCPLYLLPCYIKGSRTLLNNAAGSVSGQLNND